MIVFKCSPITCHNLKLAHHPGLLYKASTFQIACSVRFVVEVRRSVGRGIPGSQHGEVGNGTLVGCHPQLEVMGIMAQHLVQLSRYTHTRVSLPCHAPTISPT